MTDEKNEGKGFTIVDKRGRAEEESEEPSPPIDSQELPKADFNSFLLSLGTAALYHLGFVNDPETGEAAEVNRPIAKQTIDTLELLQEKTKGNLDEQETQLLQHLLTELRLRFIDAGK